MVVIGDSLLIVIRELGFSFYSFIIQDNEKFSLILRLTRTLSVCSFLCFLSLLNQCIILNKDGPKRLLLLPYFMSRSLLLQQSND